MEPSDNGDGPSEGADSRAGKGPHRLVGSTTPGRPQSPVSLLGWHMFDFVRTLGRGSSGTAELVRRKSDSCLLVMKVIHVNLDDSTDSNQNFDTEVKILSKLSHPHIVGYHGSFIHNNWLHILMDYADGGTLEDRVREAKKNATRFSKEEVMAWVCQLILALRYIHSQRILHRDIKLANVFLDGRTYVKLGDFGLARALSSETQLAETACGTPYYLSPELCLGHPYDQKSDVWAMGCVAYELMTLRRPFQGQNLHSVVMRICHEDCPPIPMECGKQMINLTYKMLSKTPSGRPTLAAASEEPFVKEFMEFSLPEMLNNSRRAAAANQFRPRHRRVSSDVARHVSQITEPSFSKPTESPTSPSPGADGTPKSVAARALDKPAGRPPRAPQTPLGIGMSSASPKSTPSPAASPVPHRIRSMFDRLHSALTPPPDGSPRSSPGTPISQSATPVQHDRVDPQAPSPNEAPPSSFTAECSAAVARNTPLQPLTPLSSTKPPSPVQAGLPMARAQSPVPSLNEIDKSSAVTCLPGVNETPQQLLPPDRAEGSSSTPPSMASTPVPYEMGTVELPDVDVSLLPKFPPVAAGGGANTAVGKEKLQLEAIATLARSKLLKENMIKDRGNLLRTYEMCFVGSDLMTLMVNYFTIEDRNLVRPICDLLLVHEVLHHVARPEDTSFLDSADEYYRFQEDIPTDVLNLRRIWDGNVRRHPSEVVKTIQRHLYQLYKAFVSPNGKTVDYDGMKGSSLFSNFAMAICELQVLDVSPLSFREKLAFYINMYNALCIHTIYDRGPPGGQIERWRMHNSISYNMNGLEYSIADFKHGIVRGNQKQPISIMRQFGDDDPRRASVLGLLDPRVHFALCEGSTSCGRLRLYTGSKIDKELQEVTSAFCQDLVKIDVADKTVCLPEVFKTYQSDFANSEAELLKWIAAFLPPSSGVDLMCTDGALSVDYVTDEWELNIKK